VDFFHGLQVAIMMTVMTNVVQFAFHTVSRKRRNKPHCQKFGPVYLLVVATLLILVQPVCMLVIGSWASMPNFFFDGGDTGDACTSDSMCHNGCMASFFDCDDHSGACNQLSCADAHKLNATLPCSCAMDSGAIVPNTTVGLCIQIFGTYLGFLLLFIGVFQATELHHKICKKFAEARGGAGGQEEDCVD